MTPLDDDLVEKNRAPLPYKRILAIWIGVFLIGLIFKILHWPFADIIKLVATGGIAGFSTYGVFYGKSTSTPVVAGFVISLYFLGNYIWKAYFLSSQSPDALWIYFVLTVVWCVGYIIWDMKTAKN